MTVSVEELVKQLGERYQDIKDKGLIPYKIKPGYEDDEKLFIDMEQIEGVFLSFFNDKEQRLHQVSLTLEDKEKTDWIFPNHMPFNLELVMTQEWIRARFGTPMVYGKPKPDGIISRGATEIYTLSPPYQNISVQFFYNFDSVVESATFYSIDHAKEIQKRVEKRRLEGLDI